MITLVHIAEIVTTINHLVTVTRTDKTENKTKHRSNSRNRVERYDSKDYSRGRFRDGQRSCFDPHVHLVVFKLEIDAKDVTMIIRA